MQILLPKVSSVSVSNKDCVHQVGGRMTMLMLLFLGTTLLQRLANLCAPTAWELSSLFLLHIFMSQDINLIQSGMIHPHYLHSTQHSAKTRVLHLIRTRYLAQTHLSTHSHCARYSTHRRHTCPVSGWGACPRTRSGRCACRTRRAPAPRRSRAPGPSWGRIRINTNTCSATFDLSIQHSGAYIFCFNGIIDKGYWKRGD